MKLDKEIPVLHVYVVWQSIEHLSRDKVNVIKNIKTIVWAAITFEPEVVYTSGWLQDITDENTY